jgi:hypothetical protein
LRGLKDGAPPLNVHVRAEVAIGIWAEREREREWGERRASCVTKGRGEFVCGVNQYHVSVVPPPLICCGIVEEKSDGVFYFFFQSEASETPELRLGLGEKLRKRLSFCGSNILHTICWLVLIGF